MVLFLYNASLSLLKNCIITHAHAHLFHEGSIRAEIHSVLKINPILFYLNYDFFGEFSGMRVQMN